MYMPRSGLSSSNIALPSRSQARMLRGPLRLCRHQRRTGPLAQLLGRMEADGVRDVMVCSFSTATGVEGVRRDAPRLGPVGVVDEVAHKSNHVVVGVLGPIDLTADCRQLDARFGSARKSRSTRPSRRRRPWQRQLRRRLWPAWPATPRRWCLVAAPMGCGMGCRRSGEASSRLPRHSWHAARLACRSPTPGRT